MGAPRYCRYRLAERLAKKQHGSTGTVIDGLFDYEKLGESAVGSLLRSRKEPIQFLAAARGLLTAEPSAMPKVDFYILQDVAPDAHLRFACRLVEKAVDQGLKVFLCTPAEDMARLDELLWTYSDRSFLPHEIATPTSPSHSRIMALIGNGASPPSHAGLLVNLCNAVPAGFETAGRLAEIVFNDSELKARARERFKFYRDQGLTIESHNV